MGNMELWYATISDKDILKTLSPSARKGAEKIFGKAKERTHLQVLGKLTDLVDEKYRLQENAPFIVRETHTKDGRPIEEALGVFLDNYFLSISDDRKVLLQALPYCRCEQKIVGVGSVGTRCWIIFSWGIILMIPYFCRLKEAQPSVLEPFVAPSAYANHGQRVVAGQRLITGGSRYFSWMGYGR